MNATEPTPRISELLRNVDKALDQDMLFVMAAGLNVYLDAMAKIGGRAMCGPDDIRRILDIWRTLQDAARIKDLATTVKDEMTEVTGAPSRPRRPQIFTAPPVAPSEVTVAS